MNVRTIQDQRASAGLTLVEVLVVLFILALLAQTAVLATEGVVEQGQRDATVRSLEAIEEAVLGVPSRVDSTGRTLIRGFVADIGRLPQAPPVPPAPQPWVGLQELWAVDSTFPRFGDPAHMSPTGDPEVRVLCGWRGPYLRLGVRSDPNESPLLDGWVRLFDCLKSDGLTLVSTGDSIDVIRSRGEDGQIGALNGGLYDADLAVTLRGVRPPQNERHEGRVAVRVNVMAQTGGSLLVARIYGPQDGIAATLDQRTAQVPVGSAIVPVDVEFLVSTIGPRVLVVYHSTLDAEPVGSTQVADLVAGHVNRRELPIVVEPGGIPPITVEMP